MAIRLWCALGVIATAICALPSPSQAQECLLCEYDIDWQDPEGTEMHRFDSRGSDYRECDASEEEQDEPAATGGPSHPERVPPRSMESHDSCHNNWVEDFSCWDTPHGPCSIGDEAASIRDGMYSLLQKFRSTPSPTSASELVSFVSSSKGLVITHDQGKILLIDCDGRTRLASWALPESLRDRFQPTAGVI